MLCVCLNIYPVYSSADGGIDKVIAKIDAYIDANPTTSIDVALVHQGKPVYKSHFVHAEKALTQDHGAVYRVGSITKIFTALAVMQLEDKGLIDIDQPVFAYLPRFFVKRRFSNVSPITIRHLLTHHSGLPTNIVKGQWSNDHFTTVIEQLRNEHISYPPDFVYAYSNIGYSLLGALIEEVTGQSYEAYVKENILQPLDMSNSFFWSGSLPPPTLVMPDREKSASDILPVRDIPAIGLYSDAADMARFLTMIVNYGRFEDRQIMHPVVLEQMMERDNADVALDYDHQVGIGLLLNHCAFSQAHKVIEHGGQTMHYTSHFVAVPEYGIAAVVLSNSSKAKGFVHAAARDMVAAALDQLYPGAEKKQAIFVAGESEKEERKVVGTENRAKYLTTSGLLTLQVDESDMCACVTGKRFDLVPVPEGWYGVMDQESATIADVEFSPQEVRGKKVLAARKDGREERIGEYVPDDGIPPLWRKRIGDYKVENPDPDFPFSDVCLFEEDNMLFFSYRMPLLSDKRIDLPLTVLDDSQAITTGLGRGRGETLLAEQTEEGEYLLYSGYLVKRISQ
jgi:CubicO group peptidase (beta-lactamase class C family)